MTKELIAAVQQAETEASSPELKAGYKAIRETIEGKPHTPDLPLYDRAKLAIKRARTEAGLEKIRGHVLEYAARGDFGDLGDGTNDDKRETLERLIDKRLEQIEQRAAV